MSQRGKFKRYLLILEHLHHTPNFKELHANLDDHGFPLSQRTLQRDLEDLRDEFGVETAATFRYIAPSMQGPARPPASR